VAKFPENPLTKFHAVYTVIFLSLATLNGQFVAFDDGRGGGRPPAPLNNRLIRDAETGIFSKESECQRQTCLEDGRKSSTQPPQCWQFLLVGRTVEYETILTCKHSNADFTWVTPVCLESLFSHRLFVCL